jgi:hypothetical protein
MSLMLMCLLFTVFAASPADAEADDDTVTYSGGTRDGEQCSVVFSFPDAETLPDRTYEFEPVADETGTVEFDGEAQITVIDPDTVDSVTVNFDAYTESGWTTTVDEPSVTISNLDDYTAVDDTIVITRTVTVTVTVLKNPDVGGEWVYIDGDCTTQPGGVEGFSTSGSIIINVGAFYGLDAEPKVTSIDAMVEERETFYIEVQNNGNIQDSYIIEVANEGYLDGEGIEVTHESSVRAGKGASKEFWVTILAGVDTSSGDYDVELLIISQGAESAGETVEDTVTVTIKVTNDRILGMEPVLCYEIVGVIILIVLLLAWLLLRRRKARMAPDERRYPEDDDDDDYDDDEAGPVYRSRPGGKRRRR